jgi:general secretion pathway protein A
MKDFGIPVTDKNRLHFVGEFNKFLLDEAKDGNNVVLIIDEAQNLKPRQLEQIRLLSNLETEKDKLLQIVLVGQPEMNQRLELYELRQLKQRIAVRYHIGSLSKDDIPNYIRHRLEVAGGWDKVKFTPEAIGLITDYSGGTPRLINILCDRALLAGFVAETRTIEPEIIRKCIQELDSNLIKANS